MRLGHRYYNTLVEAENLRRKEIWGGDAPPAPPHPAEKDKPPCRCVECQAHWKALYAKARETPPLDLKPFRAAAVAGGLYWGTYLLIEEAFSSAWKETKVTHSVSFRPWRKGQVAGVQIMRAVHDRNEGISMYRIESAPDHRTGRRAGQRATLRLRVGSNGRDPVWSEPVPFERHRAIEGRPTWVKVRLDFVADREVWTVHVVCADVSAVQGASRGVVAVDIGWRKIGDEWRIAYARDDRGETSELRMSARWAELAIRADKIRSHRDTRLVELQKVDDRFARCKAPSGVARVAAKLEDPGEEILAWLRRDRHLWQYEAGCRRRSKNARRDAMRVWARRLKDSYRTVVLKDTGHKKLKEKSDLPRPARRQGHHAAPGEVVDYLCQIFGRDEGVAIVPAVDTTASCVCCGHVSEQDAGLWVRCEQCGDERDRDLASTENMMMLYGDGNVTKPTARKTTAKFAKRHKEKEAPSQC